MKLILSFAIFLMYFFNVSAQDSNEDQIKPHEFAIGSAILSYKYYGSSGNARGAFRSGLRFSNFLSINTINVLLNVGYERNVGLSENNKVAFLYGIDATMIGFGTSGNFVFGGGPLLGVKYHINDRFTTTLEKGISFGYGNIGSDLDNGFNFHKNFNYFHRNFNFLVGYKF